VLSPYTLAGTDRPVSTSGVVMMSSEYSLRGSTRLDSVFEELLATPTARLPYRHDVLLRSYVLDRPQGAVIVYNSPGVSAATDAIRAVGKPTHLPINHSHGNVRLSGSRRTGRGTSERQRGSRRGCR
jgi:hypothetical protein